MHRLLARSAPHTRNIAAALQAGLLAGVISAFVKLGWEQLLPPRTPDRQVPPLVLLDKLGVHTESLTFGFSGTQVNWASLAVHFAFSVITVVGYSLAVEYLPMTKLWWGAAFGLGVWVVFHLLVLPALGLTPPTWDLPGDELVSEALGHVVWLVSAELVRRDVRNRITHRPDAAIDPAGRTLAAVR